MIGLIDRAQEVREGPLSHVAPLLLRLHVRKAEVDTFVDAGNSDVVSTASSLPLTLHSHAQFVVAPGGALVRLTFTTPDQTRFALQRARTGIRHLGVYRRSQ